MIVSANPPSQPAALITIGAIGSLAWAGSAGNTPE
jgi:hypothetical protein